jgi:hypothetical protein
LASQEDINVVGLALYESQHFAASATNDEDISMAFQEALLKDWGDGIQVHSEDTETTARWSLLHGSDVFFLAQEAGATKAIVYTMSNLFLKSQESSVNDWNRAAYAEPHLMKALTEVFNKFLESEMRDSHLVDPVLWRSIGENLGKVALYCTSFANVVVDGLHTIRSMRHEHFDKYRHVFFPSLCALVRIHSEEIRQIVHEIFVIHITPYLGTPDKSLLPR